MDKVRHTKVNEGKQSKYEICWNVACPFLSVK